MLDSFLPTTDPRYTAPKTQYAFDPDKGKTLLDGAGWVQAAGQPFRSKDGILLTLTLLHTNAPVRVRYATQFATQLKACGIQMNRTVVALTSIMAPGAGVSVQDFDLIALANLVESKTPVSLSEAFGCAAISSPANDWQGGNQSGWCNAAADKAMQVADDAKATDTKRKAAYATVINELAADQPILPLFLRTNITADGYDWEALYFNLLSLNQTLGLTPTDTRTLKTADLHNHAIELSVPAKMVKQPVTLIFTPQYSNTFVLDPAQDQTLATFKLAAARDGVPLTTLPLAQPMSVTVSYDPAVTGETAKTLTLWVVDAKTHWRVDASQTCPKAQRAVSLDADKNVLQVHVCALGEFVLALHLSK